MIAAMLGAPVAAALAGCRRAPRREFEGGIVGQNDALGHKLRDGTLLPAGGVGAERSRAGIVIVGGGVAGLSAAWRLERAGVRDYRVLELDDAPGGTARSGENAVSRYPWGAHYLPCPLPHARAVIALLVEMGVATHDAEGRIAFDEQQLCRSPQERIFISDRFYEGLYPHVGASQGDKQELAAFNAEVLRWSALRDGRGRRAFAVPVAAGSDDADLAALDRVSIDEWLRSRRLDGKRLRWFVEYACRDDFGTRLGSTSAWAALHYFAARVEGGHAAEFLTWPEGNGRLVAHLARSCGARLETGVAVTDIRRPDGSGDRGALVRTFAPRSGRSELITAEHVVVAMPRAFATRVLEPFRAAPPAFARAFEMGAWLVANVTLHRLPRSRGFPLAWDNVIYGSESLGYVSATHQLDPGACVDPGDPDGCRRRAPTDRNSTVWTWYLPLTDDDPRAARRRLLALSYREITDLVVTDLERAHPDIAECISRIDAFRWGHAMVRPSPGFHFSAARAEAAAPVGDIHFAHSDLSGLALFEEAQYHGVRAAEAILAARGVRTESLL